MISRPTAAVALLLAAALLLARAPAPAAAKALHQSGEPMVC